MKNQPIALVLSGGAARGLAHIGIIEVLEEQDFIINSIAGNSMGAYIAAIYAMGKLKEFKEWVIAMDKLDIIKFLDFRLSAQGFIKGDKIFRKMKSLFPDQNIETLPIPYVAVASDIKNGKEVILNKGSIYEAVRASISIPTVFTPVKKDGALLVDGGLVNPIPLNRVKRFDDNVLVGAFVNANIPYEKPLLKKKDKIYNTSYNQKIKDFKNKINKLMPENHKEKINYFRLLNKSANMLTYNLSMMNIEKYKPGILINVSRHSAETFDFFKAEELIEAGRQAAIKSISDYKTKLL